MKAHMLITTRLIVQAAGVYGFKFLFKCSWGLLLNGSIESGVECTPVAFPHSLQELPFQMKNPPLDLLTRVLVTQKAEEDSLDSHRFNISININAYE